MSGKHNKCCCGTGSYWIYSGTYQNGNIHRIDPLTGAYTAWSTGVVGRSYSLNVDPTTGYVYSANGATNTIHCLNSSGGLVWSTSPASIPGSEIMYACAVTNSGYVYAVTDGGRVHKLQANNGVEITSGWPYVATGGAVFRCVCVDQSGNVYVGGDNTAQTIRALSLSPAGSVRWTSNVKFGITGSEAASLGVYGVAINAAGTSLLAQRRTDAATVPLLHSHYQLNAATGAITASMKGAGDSSGTQFGNAVDWGSGPTAWCLQAPRSSAGTKYTILKDLIEFGVGASNCRDDLIATRDGNVFYCGQSNNNAPFNGFNVISPTLGWAVAVGSSGLQHTLAASDGRIGAFGL